MEEIIVSRYGLKDYETRQRYKLLVKTDPYWHMQESKTKITFRKIPKKVSELQVEKHDLPTVCNSNLGTDFIGSTGNHIQKVYI